MDFDKTFCYHDIFIIIIIIIILSDTPEMPKGACGTDTSR